MKAELKKPETHEWLGAYDSSWTGIITPESFAHPAKFARGLIERIFDYCLERGYLKRGDRVGDCFGGIATGGIVAGYRGLHWYGLELEPRFIKLGNTNLDLHRDKWAQTGKGSATLTQGDSRRFAENVAGVVSSPPYAESLTNGEGQEHNGTRGGKRGTTQIEAGAFAKYGSEPGQIEGIKQGTVQAVVSSPPFVDSLNNNPSKQILAGSGGRMGESCKGDGYGETTGQIGSLKSWQVDSVISSPPFSAPNMQPTSQNQGHRKDVGDCRNGHKGDRTVGNIETLKEGTVEAMVSSPPYSNIDPKKSSPSIDLEKQWKTYISQGGSMTLERFKEQQAFHGQGYGDSNGQISQLKGGSVEGVVLDKHSRATCAEEQWQGGLEEENYWIAVDKVYRSCFQAIKPNGVIVLVLKDYVSKGQRVRLCDDTCRLLEHIGFEPLERIHAMLVSETKHNDLFEGETVTKKQRKSFFRRLYEAKLPEDDERRIDYEEVLICRRPTTRTMHYDDKTRLT